MLLRLPVLFYSTPSSSAALRVRLSSHAGARDTSFRAPVIIAACPCVRYLLSRLPILRRVPERRSTRRSTRAFHLTVGFADDLDYSWGFTCREIPEVSSCKPHLGSTNPEGEQMIRRWNRLP